MDWFQPFDGTQYTTGVVYMAISNLPRELRFKAENIMILGILPGPNEVHLHYINHYLAPIVDELCRFWDGVQISTYENPSGKII